MLNIAGGTAWLTSIFTDCSVASRVVVMVQWLAHPTSNQGDAGSIPTHGTLRFSFKKDQSVMVHCYWLVTTSLDFQPSSYTHTNSKKILFRMSPIERTELTIY